MNLFKSKKFKIFVCCLLVFAISLMSFVNCFAIAGVDDTLLFITLGIVAIAYGVQVHNSTDLYNLGRLIYNEISNSVSSITDWVVNFWNNGVATVDSILLNVFNKFSDKYNLDSDSSLHTIDYGVPASTLHTEFEADVSDSVLDSHLEGTFNVLDSQFHINDVTYSQTDVFINSDSYSFRQRFSFDVLSYSGTYGNFSLTFSPNVHIDVFKNGSLVSSFAGPVYGNRTVPFDLSSPTQFVFYSVPSLSSISGFGDATWKYSLDVANSSLNTVNTVISSSVSFSDVTFPVGQLYNFDDLYDFLNGDLINTLQQLDLVNNPVYNPNSSTSGLKNGDPLTYPDVISTSNNDFVVKNVGPDVITRDKVVGGTGAIVPESDGTSSLNIPVLGNILQWLINIFNKIAEFFGGVINGIQSIISTIISSITGLGDRIASLVQSIISAISSGVQSIVVAISGFGDFLINLFSPLIDFVSGYTLYENFFSHFLPHPVAVFFWRSWQVCLFVGLIALILTF